MIAVDLKPGEMANFILDFPKILSLVKFSPIPYLFHLFRFPLFSSNIMALPG